MDRFLQWCQRTFGYPQHFDIDLDGDLYLRRYFLLGSSASGSTKTSVGNFFPNAKRAVYLHVMYRPDRDRCHHDHPWPFTTLVLWGGYHEEITHTQYSLSHPKRFSQRWNRAGMIRRNPATHTHRVSHLPAGRAYTLVFRGPKARTWGFLSAAGNWIRWTVFGRLAQEKKVLWCEDELPVQDEIDAHAEEGNLLLHFDGKEHRVAVNADGTLYAVDSQITAGRLKNEAGPGPNYIDLSAGRDE